MIGTLAIGQTLIILTAGIDLSCGAVMALRLDRHDEAGRRQRRAAACWRSSSASLACVAFGFVNGGLVTWLKLPPFIVTLGTLNIAFALDAHLLAGRDDLGPARASMTALGNSFELGGTAITYGSLVSLRVVRAGLVRALARRRGAGASTRWATTPRPRASWASRASAAAHRCTSWRARSTASRRCCSSRARTSATRTPARPRTSTRSPRWCSAARASSAAAGTIIGTLIGALDRRRAAQRPRPHGRRIRSTRCSSRASW